MKTLIIDNYDSFTYNLFHYVEQIDPDVQVFRNDEFNLSDIDIFDQIIISPGPGLPKQAGITMDVISKYHKQKRILGICLGHQAIIEAFGGELKNLDNVLHGRAIKTFINPKEDIFEGLPEVINTGRYHSFVANEINLPKDLIVISTDNEGTIQGIRHKKYDIIGLQFHPESVLTDNGFQMIKNWIEKGSPRGKL